MSEPAAEIPEDERATCEACEQKIEDGDRSDHPTFKLHVECARDLRDMQDTVRSAFNAWRRS